MNHAQKIVAASVANPSEAWALIAANSGGLHMGRIDGHRFPDGSAIVYTEKRKRNGAILRLPVEYIGAGPSYEELDR